MMSPTEKTLLAIDPGPDKSAYVDMSFGGVVVRHGYVMNAILVEGILGRFPEVLAIEDVKSYGMPVGRDVFEMCKWMGEFRRQMRLNGSEYVEIANIAIRQQICRTGSAGDANIRAALIERFGGNRKIVVGTQKNPGPLYGITKHIWSALAVGVTYLETRAIENVRHD